MCLGIPGKVLEIHEQNDLPMGKVEFGGIAKEICLAYTPEVQVGDYVIVHVGYALGKVDPDEAERTLAMFGELAQTLDDGSSQPGTTP